MNLLIKLLAAGTLFFAIFVNSGCTYYMLYKAASYDYDDSRVDRDIENIEEERTKRLIESGDYSDEQIKIINRNASRRERALTLEELRQQQAKERAERAKRK